MIGPREFKELMIRGNVYKIVMEIVLVVERWRLGKLDMKPKPFAVQRCHTKRMSSVHIS